MAVVNVKYQIKLMVILDKLPKEKFCVDIIVPYDT